jgi:hypothetical protein
MHDINPSNSMEPLKTTLEDLIAFNPDHPINIEEVLAVIKKKRGKVHAYPGTIHCEISLVVLILLARNSSAAGIKKLGVVAEPLHVMFTCIIIILINLTWCAECEGRLHYSVKAMLRSLLGGHRHPQRRDQAI